MKKRPLFWITGNYFDCKNAVDAVFEKYKTDNIAVIDADLDAFKNITSHLVKIDIFDSSVKIIKVKGILEDYKDLVPYLKYVSDKRILIMEVPVERQGKMSNSEILKYFKKNGYFIQFPVSVKIDEASSWIKQVVENHFKKTIDSDASNLLAEMKNGNLDLIFPELDKISEFLGKRKKITKDDIESCCYSNIDYDVWKFVDLLTESIVVGCDLSIPALEKCFNKFNFTKEVEMFMGAIMMRFEMLLFASDCGKNFTFNQLKEKLSKFKKKNDDVLVDKYSDGLLRMFCYSNVVQKTVASVNTGRLLNLINIIYFVGASMRANNGNEAFIKSILTTMVETIGGKINVPDFYNLFPARNKLMVHTDF